MEQFYGPDGHMRKTARWPSQVNTAVLCAASIFTQIFLRMPPKRFRGLVVWITVAAVTTAALTCTRTISGYMGDDRCGDTGSGRFLQPCSPMENMAAGGRNVNDPT